MEEPVVMCPWCECSIIIEQLNCKIFRCGIFKHNGLQMNPHETKENCKLFFEKKLIYGCGGPFKVEINEEKKVIALKCDYI